MSAWQRLFGGSRPPEPRHEHKWETIKEVEVEQCAFGSHVRTYYVYHLRCTTCGEISSREVK